MQFVLKYFFFFFFFSDCASISCIITSFIDEITEHKNVLIFSVNEKSRFGAFIEQLFLKIKCESWFQLYCVCTTTMSCLLGAMIFINHN